MIAIKIIATILIVLTVLVGLGKFIDRDSNILEIIKYILEILIFSAIATSLILIPIFAIWGVEILY